MTRPMIGRGEQGFRREEIVALLSEVAAEYAARGGSPIPVVVYGSASVVLRHEFRRTTNDIDYMLPVPSPLFEDCVAAVGRRHDFFPRWMHLPPPPWKEPRHRENLRRHVAPLPDFPEGAGEKVSFLAQDDEWLLARSLCCLRRYKRDAENILGILREERPRGKFQTSEALRQTIREVYGEDADCGWEGQALLSGLGPDADLAALLPYHRERATFYRNLYRCLILLLRVKGRKAGIDTGKLALWESLAWQTEADIRASLSDYGISLPEAILAHIARQMFAPEHLPMLPAFDFGKGGKRNENR